jgi:hypothetical protein
VLGLQYPLKSDFEMDLKRVFWVILIQGPVDQSTQKMQGPPLAQDPMGFI